MTDSVISRFEIQLDAGDEPIFKGGEVITGRLLIELKQPIILNAIKLQMKGRAVWVNDPMKKDDIEKVLFDNDFTLLERPPGKPEPGHFEWISDFTYSLPFECPLPKGCPTSYEGPYAFIRYFIRASLVHEENSGHVKEYYVKKAFSIVSPSDGHLIQGEPQTATDSAVFGKCCCKGKLTAELTLPKTGYLPGEEVVGTIKVGNKHPKDILKQLEVRLVDRVHRIGAPEIAEKSPWRVLLYRKLEDSEEPKSKSAITKDSVRLLTIPPVCPTTKGDFDSVTNEVHNLSPFGRLLESPSTATLKFRKTPFIRIEYAIQLSLGPFLLLEVPIDVGEHSTRDTSVSLTPFVAGAQPIQERDELEKQAIGGPFVYTPVYPYKENLVIDRAPAGELIRTIIVEEPVANGSQTQRSEPEPVTKVVIDAPQTTSAEPEETIERHVVTTVKTVYTHSDNDGTQIVEETVVDKDGEVSRTVEETTVTDEGVATHTVEQTEVDAEGHETTTRKESTGHIDKDQLDQVLHEGQDLAERLEEAIEQTPQSHNPEEVGESSPQVDGDEVKVITEEFEKDGVQTIRTTTITRHADGSESTLVQEHSSTTIEEVVENPN